MTKVLVVATSRKTRGGITAVIKAHEKGEQWKRFHCHWVQTHRDGPAWRKIAYLLLGYMDYLVRVPFYDIVHFHISLPTTVKRKLPLMRIAKLLGKKTIVHLHCGSQLDEIWNKQYDEIFAKCDEAIVLSKSLKDKLKDLSNSRIDAKVCYNPCPDLLPTNAIKTDSILFSGTVCRAKGYQDLIKAFAKVARKYPNWELIIAGNGEIDKGQELAKQYGISEQVKFKGWVRGNEKDLVFGQSKIFCLPSYAEGFPMAVLDAWAYSLPVITTPVGGVPDIAQDGENMLLFEPGDVDALANKLDMLMQDGDLRMKLSTESSKLAQGIFSQKTINNQIGYIYEHLSK